MITIAQSVKKIIESNNFSAFSFTLGYGVTYEGKIIQYYKAHSVSEKKSAKGRVIKSIFQYADNSKLEYCYSERTGQYKINIQ